VFQVKCDVPGENKYKDFLIYQDFPVTYRWFLGNISFPSEISVALPGIPDKFLWKFLGIPEDYQEFKESSQEICETRLFLIKQLT